uniref:Quinone oxidoreductase n=2 Tax=Cacopsylla melanoneura TaxID=428564 RepID=A0A8D8SXT4_9HEMI
MSFSFMSALLLSIVLILWTLVYQVTSSDLEESKMYAVQCKRWGEPKVLELTRVNKPPPCQPDEVLVKVVAAGINPVETYIRSGQYPTLPELPAILGTEVSGVVEQVGAGVTHVQVGDKVFGKPILGKGGYSQYAKLKKLDVYHMPPQLSFSEAAVLYVSYFTAYRALHFKAQMKPGEWVLVHGATGGVGSAAIQIAKAHGLKVVAFAGTDSGKQYVESLGADVGINYNDIGCYDLAIQSIGGKKFDIVLEPFSNVMLANDLTMINKRGRICVVGSRGQIHVNPRGFMQTEVQIYGVSLLSQTPEEGRHTAAILTRGAAEGWVKPNLNHEFFLDELPDAHKAIMKPGSHRGKLVVSNIDQFYCGIPHENYTTMYIVSMPTTEVYDDLDA